MAYKRHISRLPIIPANATKHNVVCHYCIVGCGYHAYSWDVNTQGGTAPSEFASAAGAPGRPGTAFVIGIPPRSAAEG